jgi:polysaccharide export outer membrane protein
MPRLTEIWKSTASGLAGMSVLFCALSCLSVPNASAQGITPAPAKAATAASSPLSEDYKLGEGDKLRVTVYGEMDLSGEFLVDDSGFVRLPLVGQIQASGLGLRDFEGKVKSALDAGYLKDARVSVDVINYRPFYILGQVNKPGEYPYVNGMTVLNAVALAGGYTYRASESSIYIRRKGTDKEQSARADQSTKVLPGDIIRIPERFF